MISLFELDFAEDWDKFFKKLDKNEREKIWKKIQKLKSPQTSRHLRHGLPFFVVESEQDRIAFKEKEKIREIMFAGNHKQYEKWYKNQ